MKVAIIGSRSRDEPEDLEQLIAKFLELDEKERITEIVTGDCFKGADQYARDILTHFSFGYEIKLTVKRIKHPKTGEEMDFNDHPWFDYFTLCKIFYARDKEIAKEDVDYLIALVNKDRSGGTEKTISYFKKYHKDWRKKLILI